jgi:hypothetical protein
MSPQTKTKEEDGEGTEDRKEPETGNNDPVLEF